MPLYIPVSKQPNTFPAPQKFTGSITIIVDGVEIKVRPKWATVTGGRLEVGWEMSRDGQNWKDAGSYTHGS